MDIFFLTLEEVLIIHQDQIENYGGSFGIRDKNLLISAISQPKITFKGSFLHKNLYEMAASYLFHIIQNHSFIDGNKRTGLVSALMFLELNNVEFDEKDEVIEKMVLNIAKGKITKSKITAWLKKKSTTFI